MSGPFGALLLVLIGYLIGAVPFGMLAGRLAGGVDLRQHGSRRTGATNTLRTLGPRWGALVLLLDLAKGAAAVLLARAWYEAGPPGSPEWVQAAAGVAAVIGHNYSAFIGFTGGRGVATAGGGMLVISPWTLAVLAPIVIAVVWLTRYVSLGSLVAAAAAPLITAVLATAGVVGWGAFGYALACGILIATAHGDNISRLRAGTERRLGEREGERERGHDMVAGDGRG
ncbi:MAG TPA: glycerol-3-phosphate 1-O-acyltransferase PlsY [Candidatus Limnocylindria bacterium]|nr:glycerol-3-phosphate 1-O-acyltransferase PlsY [Candidatus Limnocylindria bacterium]